LNKIIYVIKKLYNDNEGLWIVTGFIYVLLLGLTPWATSAAVSGFELFLVKVAAGLIITGVVGMGSYLAYNLLLVLKDAFISARSYAREYDDKNKKQKEKI
jgi:hypothetical protein